MAGNLSSLAVTLEDLNDEETAKRTSAIVYLSIVMALGIPGNLLVIAVYFGTLKRRQATHWMYIRALAITDFLVCTVAIPFELYQQTHQLTFYSDGSCKFFRAVSIHLSLTSALLLIAMSGNRLRKICQPLKKQLTLKQGYITVGIVVAVAVLFCWPEAVISGVTIEKLDNNLTGYDCSFSDRFRGKDYTTIYSTLLMVVYLLCMLALVIMYLIVGREVLKRGEFQTNNRLSYAATGATTTEHTSTEHLSDTIDDKSEAVESKGVIVEVVKATETSIDKNSKIPKDKYETSNTNKRKKTSKKVTRIAFAISFCFILSYLPYVAVKLNASVAKGKFTRTPVTDAIFPILARTFVINNIINPLIYGFLDPTFLQHCKLTMRYIFCMKR